jgi:hypothetical protein
MLDDATNHIALHEFYDSVKGLFNADTPIPGPIPFEKGHALPHVIRSFSGIILVLKGVLAGWTENGKSFCLIIEWCHIAIY